MFADMGFSHASGMDGLESHSPPGEVSACKHCLPFLNAHLQTPSGQSVPSKKPSRQTEFVLTV